ncbi:hypothetical protein [Lentibacillus halodurans]|nr:hypothetical protein [Lentibacillus halodurans]
MSRKLPRLSHTVAIPKMIMDKDWQRGKKAQKASELPNWQRHIA